MIVRDIVSDIVRNVARDPWGKGEAIPEWMKLGWNLFRPDPLIGPEPVFSVASANYDENGNNIGLNPRIDAGKGLWMGPAVTNLLPAGAENFATWGGTGTVASGQDWRGTAAYNSLYKTYASAPIGTYTFSVENLSVNGGDGTVAITVSHSGGTNVFTTTDRKITFTTTSVATIVVYIGSSSTWTLNEIVSVSGPMLTATSVKMPYVPPGFTQPTNAATTGGNGTNIPLDAGLLRCFGNGVVPAVCTVMAEHYMGVGSADLAIPSTHSIMSVNGADTGLLYSLMSPVSGSNLVKAYDGYNSSQIVGSSWSANEIHRRYVQTSSDGTKFRVGYQRYTSAMVEITSDIQWSHTGAESTWATFDGSFNPLSWLRLCLNVTVPIWGRKIVIANKSLSAAEISDAWGLVA